MYSENKDETFEISREEDIDIDFSEIDIEEKFILEEKIKKQLSLNNLEIITNAVKLQPPLQEHVKRLVYRIAELIEGLRTERDINSIVNGLDTDTELMWCLLVIVRLSGEFLQDIPEISKIAARAITVLNAARIAFSGMNLNDVQVPEANLSYGIFDLTQFQRSNLDNVKLRGAWLNGANFSQASMQNIFFGEYPYLELPHPVKFFCISPNGCYLAVSFLVIVKKPIIIYSLETLNVVQSIVGEMRIGALVYSPNNQQLASSNDSLIQLWDPKTGGLLKTLGGHTEFIDVLAYNSNGEQLVSGSRDKTIKLWDIKTGNLLYVFKGHSVSIKNLVYSHNGRQLVSGSLDKTIRLWNIDTNELQMILEGHTDNINVIVFRPDDLQLASGSLDETIRLWNLNSKDNIYVVHLLKGHTDSVEALSYSPDNMQLASASRDNTVRLWDVMTGNLQHTLFHHSGVLGVTCVSYSYDGLQLVSGSHDNSIRLWNPKTGELRQTLNGHSNGISFLTYELGGRRLISGSAGDKTVRWWDIADIEQYSPSARNYIKHATHVNTIAFRPDGKQLASGDGNNLIILWEVKNDTACSQKILTIHSSSINTLAYRFDSKQLASGSSDNNIILWDSEGNLYKTLNGHEHYISTVIYRQDGKQLASGSGDSTVKLWDPESGDCLRSLEGHSHFVTTLSYCADGRQLASGSHDNKVLVWDSVNGTLLRNFDFGNNGRHVNLVCFKEDWQLAAYSSDGYSRNVVNFWNVMDGELLESKTGGNDERKQLRQWVAGDVDADEIDSSEKVMATAWSLDRTYLATAGFDATVRLFRVVTENSIKAQLLWSSHQSTALNASLANFTSSILSKENESLLRLHGAIFEEDTKNDKTNCSKFKDPFMPMYKASKSRLIPDSSKMSQEKLESKKTEIDNTEFQGTLRSSFENVEEDAELAEAIKLSLQ